MSTRISKILAKDILSGKSKFMKDGYITFDKLVIEPNSVGYSIVHFYLSEVFLMSIKVVAGFKGDSTFTFDLSDGTMAMKCGDKDLCDEPDLGFRERIEAAITEIREALNEEEEYNDSK